MTHKDFIDEVAKRLGWPKDKTSGIIETIIEVVGTELKMNNPVVIDSFGTLKTDIQAEYILVNPETQERHLMPPAIEIVFEAFSQENGGNSLPATCFTPDEALYIEVNSSFAQFEPTPLNEGVQFPGIPEIVVGEQETEDETPALPLLQEEQDVLPEEISRAEPEPEVEEVEIETETETTELTYPQDEEILLSEDMPQSEPEEVERPVVPKKQSPPRSRSRRGLRTNKRTSSVWIPISGGIAIVVASLFFFKGDRDR